MSRFIVIVLDGFGIGAMPADATTGATASASAGTDATTGATASASAGTEASASTDFSSIDNISRTTTSTTGVTISGTYATAQDYIDALNANGTWVTYDAASNTAAITSVADFCTAMDMGLSADDYAKIGVFGCGFIGSEKDYIQGSVAGTSVFRATVAFGGGDLPGEMADLAKSVLDGTADKDVWDPIALVYMLCLLQFRKLGWTIAAVEYRLSGEAPFPAAVHDVKSAVRFLKHNAEKYGLDKDRFAAMGGSAGGNLSAMLAVSADHPELDDPDCPYNRESCAVAAAVDWFGPVDFAKMDEQARANGFSFTDHGH